MMLKLCKKAINNYVSCVTEKACVAEAANAPPPPKVTWWGEDKNLRPMNIATN